MGPFNLKDLRFLAVRLAAVIGLLGSVAGVFPGFACMAQDPPADADSPVGFEVIHVPNGSENPLIGAVWYPTSDQTRDMQIESFTQPVALSGHVKGRGLPLVILSHGGGGSFASHYDTALALAQAGFVVAAISHAGDTYDDQSKVMMVWRRSQQLSGLLDYMLTAWRGHSEIDARRVGAFGFSNGGFAVLVEAGGVPDLMTIDPYCRAHPDHDLCTALTKAGVRSVSIIKPPPEAWKRDGRIKAIAAAAPAFGFTFSRAGLKAVRIPVLLLRAQNDAHQPSPWYEEHLLDALPVAPEYRVEPLAGHYDFLPPCSEVLAGINPNICSDAQGFDRADFHRRLNVELVRFFQKNLI